MSNWLLLSFLVGLLAMLYIQFRRTGDSLYAALLLVGLGYSVISLLNAILYYQTQSLIIPWTVIESVYYVIVIGLGLTYGFRMLFPYPFLRASQLYAKIIELRKNGQIDRALNAARQMVALYPRRADARYWLGVLQFDKGNFREAVRHLKVARSLEPNSVGILLELGNSYGVLENYQGALESYALAEAVAPGNAEVQYKLGIALNDLGRSSEAVSRLELARELDPDSVQISLKLARIYKLLNRYEDAIKTLERILADNSENVEVTELIEACRQELQMKP